MYLFYYILCTFFYIENNAFGLQIQSKPVPLSREIDVPRDSIIEQLSKKVSITECTMQCLHHHSESCCGVGFLGEEMVTDGNWNILTCFLLKNFECTMSNNNIKLKTMVCKRIDVLFLLNKIFSLPKEKFRE